MRVSWNWLRELCDPTLAPDEVARRLTLSGLEVEGLERLGEGFDGVVVAEVASSRPHPKSKKLTLVTVTDGQGTHEVVCGAPNVPAAGRKVLWARPGAHLPGGVEIAVKEVGGVASPGMLCSQVELGLGEDASGIIVLEGEDAAAAPGADAADALALRDVVLEVNVTPNRGDCLGHLGIAREVAALTGAPLARPDASLEVYLDERPVAELATVAIEDPQGCPRYTASVLSGLTVGPSPRWLRRRLEAVGVRPLSNLVDVTNYVLFELGHPLHAFDADRLPGRRIVVRRARAGERMRTLDEQERALEPTDLLICDGDTPVALAGVMGGAGSEIGAGTGRVLLEAATFDPGSIRRTARRLGLHSESSHRFERGVDASGLPFAAARAARLLCELGGGRVARGLVDVHPRPSRPRIIDLRPARVALVLGTALPRDEIAACLRRLELQVEDAAGAPDATEASAGPASLRVTCPTVRADLEREIDLIEEVARLAGLDRIPSRLPPAREAPRPSGDPLAEQIRDALRGAGLDEAILFGFTSPARVAALRFADGRPEARPIAVLNPLREDHSVMRTSLLSNLLGALARNLARGARDVALFEVGHVFLPSGRELPDEPRRVAGVLCGERAGWLKPAGALDFWDAKGVVEHLCAVLRVPVRFRPPVDAGDAGSCPYLHPGVAAEVVLADGSAAGDAHVLGVVGEVHPETRELSGIERRCFAFELDLERLPARAPAQLRAIPRFPAVVRDVSFFVDERVPSARVRALIDEARVATVEDVRVLEDYREAGRVPAGKKGMLWSITYRAQDRTLTDAEVDAAHERLVSGLLVALGAERR